MEGFATNAQGMPVAGVCVGFGAGTPCNWTTDAKGYYKTNEVFASPGGSQWDIVFSVGGVEKFRQLITIYGNQVLRKDVTIN